MNLLSTSREGDIDRITRTARKVLGTEIALVSLIDEDRQWFKSRCGLDVTETPRDVSFCGHAIHGDRTFVVPDAAADERFRDNPLVTGGPRIRFYAGQPLTNSEGFRVGTLCVISPSPREMSESEKRSLEDLGRLVEIILDNRELSETQRALLEEIEAANRDRFIDPLSGLWNRRGFDDLFGREIDRAIRKQSSLAIAILDIDHFKRINDTYGHPTGDEAIKLAAEALVTVARSTDVVARYGGEEFALVAPDVVPAILPAFADKLLAAFRAQAKLKTRDGIYPFTASMGITVAFPKKNSPGLAEALLKAADQALYEAKTGGRDRFVISGVPDSLYSEFALT
jgi:diguanylate cyclase (GGDEF)-like protein